MEVSGASTPDELRAGLPTGETGRWLHDLCAELYPIGRSITGDGVRRTLERISQHIPLEAHEVPSGTEVFDWRVPKEWNVRDAYIKDPDGRRVVDWRRSSLHLVSYSVPVHRRMTLEELRPHLYSLPDQPSWIPYRTSYYTRNWGFCLRHDQLTALEEGDYEVVVDTTLTEGSLTYGECLVPGAVSDEVLLSCHVCHPALVNDNLSGVSVMTLLGALLQSIRTHYTYRLLFIPGTIGSITWLALNEASARRIHHGLVICGVGDPGALTYKRSRRGDAEVDRTACHVLERADPEHQVRDFSPYGYDERQFCSPGFNLPVGRLSRTPHGEYPEYHTSADDLDLVRPEQLADSLGTVLGILGVLEGNGTYRNLNPRCEPQLGRRGLYRSIGGTMESGSIELALLWVLNLSDGEHSLLDIAERSGLAFTAVRRAADVLLEHDLLAPVAGAL